MKSIAWVAVLMLGIFISGCTTSAIRMSSALTPDLDIREHVFASQPIWEALDSPRALDGDQKSKQPQDQKVGLATLDRDNPAIAVLWKQAFGVSDLKAAKEKSPDKSVSAAAVDVSGLKTKGPNTTDIAVASSDIDNGPLPPGVAKTAVVQSFIKALTVSHHNALGRIKGKEVVGPDPLLNGKLSMHDFWEFNQELARSLPAVFQTDAKSSVKAAAAAKDNICKTGELRWYCLFLSYFVDYYNGKFADRNGSLLSKPKLGMTISNETITGTATAFLEATYDWAIIASRGKLKVPVVFTGELSGKDVKWVTPTDKQPSFARAVLAIMESDKEIKPWVEPLNTSGGVGISKLKLCGIRYVGGVTSDAAQSLSGAIVRLFGGADLGFVVLGKFSVGDNDTLAKLVDTFVEVTSRRVSEGFLTNLLYDLKENELPDAIGKAVLGFLPDCK
jgi:hypothetical protein